MDQMHFLEPKINQFPRKSLIGTKFELSKLGHRSSIFKRISEVKEDQSKIDFAGELRNSLSNRNWQEARASNSSSERTDTMREMFT